MRSATFPPAHPAPVAIPDDRLRTARVPGRSAPAYARRSAVPSPGDWLLALYYTAALFGFGLVSFMPSMLGTQSRPISIGYHVLILVAGLTILLTRPTPFRARRSLGFAAFAVFWILYSARMINDLLMLRRLCRVLDTLLRAHDQRLAHTRYGNGASQGDVLDHGIWRLRHSGAHILRDVEARSVRYAAPGRLDLPNSDMRGRDRRRPSALNVPRRTPSGKRHVQSDRPGTHRSLPGGPGNLRSCP